MDEFDALRRAPQRFWRTFAAAVAQPTPAHRFELRGLEHLVHAQRRGRGTILVTYHGAVSGLGNVVLAQQTGLGKIPTISLERAEQMADGSDEPDAQDTAGWAAGYALQAQRILSRGGMVKIVNDVSYPGANALVKTVGQRQYSLKPGFAELGLSTGAAILPTFTTLDATGRLCLTILPALRPAAGLDHRAAVHDLLDRYAAFLTVVWRQAPAAVGWGSLRRYTTQPPADAGASRP